MTTGFMVFLSVSFFLWSIGNLLILWWMLSVQYHRYRVREEEWLKLIRNLTNRVQAKDITSYFAQEHHDMKTPLLERRFGRSDEEEAQIEAERLGFNGGAD